MKQNLKMICSDIDGTLLDKHRFLSTETIDTFERIIKKYKPKVILVSARMPKAMRYLQKALQIKEPLIAYNGALVVDALDEDSNAEILHDVSIPLKTVKKVYKKADDLDLHISIYSYDDWHVNKVDWGTEREINNTRTEPNTTSGLKSIVNSYVSLGKHIHKIMCIGDEKSIDKLESYIKDKHKDDVNAYRSKDTYLELSPKAISKAKALKILHDKYGIKRKEIIAFGDNYNDVDMLDYVGVGVAVENARKEAKKVANYVTKHHKEDGVAIALNKFFK